jgi:hypothetical protein
MWSRLVAFAALLLPGPALADVKEKVAALAPSWSETILWIAGS